MSSVEQIIDADAHVVEETDLWTYATYWFGSTTLELVEEFQDNVIIETDFPHPTSLTPGPGCVIDNIPSVFGRKNLAAAGVPEPVQRTVLYENAARLYRQN